MCILSQIYPSGSPICTENFCQSPEEHIRPLEFQISSKNHATTQQLEQAWADACIPTQLQYLQMFFWLFIAKSKNAFRITSKSLLFFAVLILQYL